MHRLLAPTPERTIPMTDLYAVRVESGAGALDGDVVAVWDSLADARDEIPYRKSMAGFERAQFAIYRMEPVGDDDD